MDEQSTLGSRIRRKEDPRFITGKGSYIDDLSLPNMSFAAILRSPYAHAKIRRVDTSRVLKHPGVVAVVTGKDTVGLTNPLRTSISGLKNVSKYALAVDKVRFNGEAVAAVAATDRASAEDALELFDVEYEPLPPVTDALEAIKPDSPLVYEEAGTNVAWHRAFEFGDLKQAFAGADLVIEENFGIHRYSSTPLETYGGIASYDQVQESLTIWANDQNPGWFFSTLCHVLKMSGNKVRLIVPDIGGSFGNKFAPPYLVILSLLSMKARRPVKWIESRREHLMALCQTCEGHFYVRAAFKKDGELVALRIRDIEDEGTALLFATVHNLLKLSNLNNAYKVKNLSYEAYSVVTNKCPAGANRGIGRPGMVFMAERMMDIAAKKLGLDPAEIRFRNFIQPEEFPYHTPTGNVYDSGNYPEALRRTLSILQYSELRSKQESLRKEGRYLGIGFACSVEPSTANLAYRLLAFGDVKELNLLKLPMTGAHEAAWVKMDSTGKIYAAIGSPSSGQGHETVIAQVVANELGVSPDDVTVDSLFDTQKHPWTGYSGIAANKFVDVDLGAVVGAARKVKSKMIKIASHLLEASEQDITLKAGKVSVRGYEKRALDMSELAHIAYHNVILLPKDLEPGLEATHSYTVPGFNLPDEDGKVRMFNTFPNEIQSAVVEVDLETGQVQLLRYLVVHDCGVMLNPLLVEGQLHGATAHGIAASLLEEFVYNSDGQLLTSTFMDYLKPTAMETPDIQVEHLICPSPFTVLGAKGVGESGANPPMATIANAVEDALAPLGVRITRMPLTSQRLRQLIKDARK